MSTITREWLQQAINDYESVRDELPFGLDDYQGNILAALRIALASLEAEPVAWKVTFTQIDREYNTFTGMYSDKAEVERWVRLHKACNFLADITPLYTAQPVPVTPDGWISCSERMPENIPGSCKEYLVFDGLNNKVHHDYWVVPDGDSAPVASFWNHYGAHVTHWMPLPEPPQEAK
ncbi:DUF551 domain-containing protein [Escherichia coli]|uniref:DUF551 domain-containing protein n=1 Tax=Escherichia coli TaxID=562 RepID=UPI000DEAEB63|nr:DUF551 domain-containing protein [Escherichia coli]RBX92650.1 DUF551 domain-containing protein [Escherichia coli]